MGQVFNARKSKINRRLLISNLSEHSVKTFNNILNSCYFSQLLRTYNKCGASFVAQLVKNLPAMGSMKTWVQFLGQEDPWRRKWKPTLVFLPGESHGQRSLAGYCPWGRKSQTRLSD